MSHALANNRSIALLKERAQLLHKARLFFEQRGMTEVDCPILSRRASVDAYIDLIEATVCGERYFLHSSPEYGMKRLLAAGMGDIYQLSHVFRDGDRGQRHSPEFLMAEWYRLHFQLEEMIQETADFIALFLEESLVLERLSYKEAFEQRVGIESSASLKALRHFLEEQGEVPPETDNREELIDLLFSLYVEPHLGQGKLTVITPYPAQRAALAQTTFFHGEKVALRFEIYHRGVELANGYQELLNAAEQRARFIEANTQRQAMGKQELPLDSLFLEALERGLPPCCGVSVGVDRLFMLRHHEESLDTVMPFSWEEQ